jgi:hypothetical protein
MRHVAEAPYPPLQSIAGAPTWSSIAFTRRLAEAQPLAFYLEWSSRQKIIFPWPEGRPA